MKLAVFIKNGHDAEKQLTASSKANVMDVNGHVTHQLVGLTIQHVPVAQWCVPMGTVMAQFVCSMGTKDACVKTKLISVRFAVR